MHSNKICDTTSLRLINTVYFSGAAVSILGCVVIRRDERTTTTLNEATYFLKALIITFTLSAAYIAIKLLIDYAQQIRLISKTLKPR
jgi:hypothetical protein